MPKKTVTGLFFGVTVEVKDEHLKALKKAPEYVRETYEGVAKTWHSDDLPKHFERGAHGRYGYAQRDQTYLKRKGFGPDLVKTGAMRDALKSKAQMKKRATGVELKMTARALNFVPNSDNPFDTQMVKQSNGRKYPNMKLEVRQTTEDEQEGLRRIAETRLAVLFQKALV